MRWAIVSDSASRTSTRITASGVDMIRNATLALVSFLIGFGFAGAGGRFIERQDMIVKEANAIGTVVAPRLMLPEPQKGDLQAALKQYTADRLELVKNLDSDHIEILLAKASEPKKRIWQARRRRCGQRPRSSQISCCRRSTT